MRENFVEIEQFELPGGYIGSSEVAVTIARVLLHLVFSLNPDTATGRVPNEITGSRVLNAVK